MSNVGTDSDFLDDFLEGAARAIFVLAYADFAEQASDDDRFPIARNGEDWYDRAPETPPAAYALAGRMWSEIEARNGASIYAIAEWAATADDAQPDPEKFGRDLAMEWMGTGVSWEDDHAPFGLEIPHGEVSGYTFDESAYAPKKGS